MVLSRVRTYISHTMDDSITALLVTKFVQYIIVVEPKLTPRISGIVIKALSFSC